MAKNGKIVIISGPSGVGKSTICRKVAEILGNVYLSISVTTRPKSESELNGQDYRFISKEKFRQRIREGSLLEHAEVFGNMYGTPKQQVEQALKENKTVILEIDTEGAKQVKDIYEDAIMIFVLPPEQKDLAERMKKRARENHNQTAQRLSQADNEIADAWKYYNNMVINDNLQQAVNEVIQIIKSNTGDQ